MQKVKATALNLAYEDDFETADCFLEGQGYAVQNFCSKKNLVKMY